MRRAIACAAIVAALLVAGCGGSSAPKGPPDLLFVSVRDGDYAIFGSAADGEHAHRLTDEKGDPSTPKGLFFQIDPAWSPDATKIAFASSRQGVSHIFVMNADGTGTRRLTDGARADEQPSWSPDGRSTVFGREGAIYRVPATGGTPIRVGSGIGNAQDPSWSPDGKLIAYDYRRPGFSIREVYVMNADGTHPRRLTDLGDVSAFPAWSPDGTRLAFQSGAHGGHNEIYTVPVAGGAVKRVTTSDVDAIQPDWSPDGVTIAFSRDGAIWTTENGDEQKLTNEDDNDSAPAWRPDVQK